MKQRIVLFHPQLRPTPIPCVLSAAIQKLFTAMAISRADGIVIVR
jgi:hypothetical protein